MSSEHLWSLVRALELALAIRREHPGSPPPRPTLDSAAVEVPVWREHPITQTPRLALDSSAVEVSVRELVPQHLQDCQAPVSTHLALAASVPLSEHMESGPLSKPHTEGQS